MITSEELNFLVWKYLQEEGLFLAAAALDRETSASRWDRNDMPSGELIQLVLKGKQLASIEETVSRQYLSSKLISSEPITPTNSNLPKIELESPICGGLDVLATDDGLVVAGPESAVYYNVTNKDTKNLESGGDVPTTVCRAGSDSVFVGYVSGALRQWGVQSHDLLSLMMPESESAPVILLRVNKFETYVATASSDNTIRVWDIGQRALLAEHKYTNFVEDIHWLGEERSFCVCTRDGVEIFRFSPLNIASASSTPMPQEAAAELPVSSTVKLEPSQSFDVPFACVALADPLSELLFFGTYVGTVAVVSVDHKVDTFRAHSSRISALLHPNNNLLTASVDGTVTLWNLSPRVIASTRNIGEPVVRLELAPQQNLVAVQTPDSVRILHLQTLDVVGHINQKGVQAISWLGSSIAVTSENNTDLFTISPPAPSLPHTDGGVA